MCKQHPTPTVEDYGPRSEAEKEAVCYNRTCTEDYLEGGVGRIPVTKRSIRTAGERGILMNRDTDRNLGPRWIVITLLAVGVGGVLYFGWPFFSAMGDPKQVERWILDAGAWGPAMFILLQIAQMLVAPLPGQIMALIGGYLFGSWIGLLYTMIGVMMGSALIFALARKLGRPFVRRFVRPDLLREFDHLTREKGAFVFFLMYLLPGFPDDILSFIAGFTLIPVRRLLLISLVGRLPENAVQFTGSATRLKISISCWSLWLRSSSFMCTSGRKGMDPKICRSSGSDRVLETNLGRQESEHPHHGVHRGCPGDSDVPIGCGRSHLQYKQQWIKAPL